MKYLIAILASFALPAQAETAQDKVLACFAQMDTTTDWNTCLNTMFAPCAGQEVGSETHVACLTEQREDWRASKRSAEDSIMTQLDAEGAEGMATLMFGWLRFLDDKCTAVAKGRAEISYEAAHLGCQISEYALMTNELNACLEGRSTEDYCQIE